MDEKGDVPEIPRLPEPETPRRGLSDEERDRLLKAALEDHDPDAFLFMAMGTHTPMRHTEITSTRFEHFFPHTLEIYLPRAKGGARIQPITQQLADLLEAEMKRRGVTDGWVFPSRRAKSGHRTYMYGPFRRSVLRAGLKLADVTPHALRHDGVTTLAHGTANVKTIMAVSATSPSPR